LRKVLRCFDRLWCYQHHVSNYRELRKPRNISQGSNSYFLFFNCKNLRFYLPFKLVLLCECQLIVVTFRYQYCGNRTLRSLNITAVANSGYPGFLHCFAGMIHLPKMFILRKELSYFGKKLVSRNTLGAILQLSSIRVNPIYCV
jgi:hypothetical protein